MKLDNYLWKCINADPHFFFSREDNEIKTTVDSPFFVEGKLCKTLVHFLLLVTLLSVPIISLSI